MSWRVIEGDVNEFLPWLDDNSFDAAFCDPPYGLEFMGKEWDKIGRGKADIASGLTKGGSERFANSPPLPSFGKAGAQNRLCRSCGGSERGKDRKGFRRCVCETPDLPTRDYAAPGRIMQQWYFDWAREVYRVLKPGAHLLAFGGTRTHHRLMCAIEDAGFEIRDCMMLFWVTGQGFPKALDISKAIDKEAGARREVVGKSARHGGGTSCKYAQDAWTQENAASMGMSVTAPATDAAKLWSGYASALKPAYEPIILAMEPCEGTFAGNALKWGVGGLNVDGCRIGVGTDKASGGNRGQNRVATVYGGKLDSCAPTDCGAGRWPSNLLLSCACDGEHDPGCPVRLLDEQTGDVSPGTMGARHTGKHDNLKYGYGEYDRGPGYGDRGGPSRFFYVSKSSTSEREHGLIGHLPCTTCGGLDTAHHLNDKGDQVLCRRNDHPTQKPLKLCEYLARLLLPPKRDTPRRILVPFAGAGSEMIGALKAGWDEVIGIEIDHHYCQIAEARLAMCFSQEQTVGGLEDE